MPISSPRPAPPSTWLSATLRRVEEQRLIVETLQPGSKAHRTAVELLLMYQDTLHVLTEAHELLARLREAGAR